jgi:hypothetical protein
MWEPWRLTTLWASAACCRDSFALLCFTLLYFTVSYTECTYERRYPTNSMDQCPSWEVYNRSASHVFQPHKSGPPRIVFKMHFVLSSETLVPMYQTFFYRKMCFSVLLCSVLASRPKHTTQRQPRNLRQIFQYAHRLRKNVYRDFTKAG